MLETILKLYTMAMALDVRSPMPHLVGPPGCGKSSVVAEAASLIGTELHIINVSRLSPLELEGVQMPVTKETAEMRLRLLHATHWTQLEEGNILLLDEFLRGFPEVYNGLLDIFTSREVAGYKLPRVFIIAASNSVTAYDKALSDRLLHLPVPDPRKKKSVKKDMAQRLVQSLNLLPSMVDSLEMNSLLDSEVLPMFEVLDHLHNSTSSPASLPGTSIRNLIGQALLRQVENPLLGELIQENNRRAMKESKPQFVLLLEGRLTPDIMKYENAARQLIDHPSLSSQASTNLKLNLQLIEMEHIRNEKGTSHDEPPPDDGIFD